MTTAPIAEASPRCLVISLRVRGTGRESHKDHTLGSRLCLLLVMAGGPGERGPLPLERREQPAQGLQRCTPPLVRPRQEVTGEREEGGAAVRARGTCSPTPSPSLKCIPPLA